MRKYLGHLNDPALHVVVIVVLLVGTALSLGERPSSRPSSRVGIHPADCHACSVLKSRAARERDAILVEIGAIDEADILD
jgi:hypothetical protein